MIKKTSCFDTDLSDGRLTVTIHGEIDHHGAVAMRADIDKIICEQRPDCLVIDLSSVEFMDSSGLGLIMGRYSLMSKLGGGTVLRNPNASIAKILKLAGMDRIIKTERTGKV